MAVALDSYRGPIASALDMDDPFARLLGAHRGPSRGDLGAIADDTDFERVLATLCSPEDDRTETSRAQTLADLTDYISATRTERLSAPAAREAVGTLLAATQERLTVDYHHIVSAQLQDMVTRRRLTVTAEGMRLTLPREDALKAAKLIHTQGPTHRLLGPDRIKDLRDLANSHGDRWRDLECLPASSGRPALLDPLDWADSIDSFLETVRIDDAFDALCAYLEDRIAERAGQS